MVIVIYNRLFVRHSLISITL